MSIVYHFNSSRVKKSVSDNSVIRFILNCMTKVGEKSMPVNTCIRYIDLHN
jgi:hypothetical protein